jgi:hypothetical protein
MTSNAIGNTVSNDFTITKASNGTTVTKTISETNNSGGSYAEQNIKVAGASSGDAWSAWCVGTTNQFAFGIDNSDSDKLKLTYAANSVTPSSATQIMNITTAGEITKPLQSCFCATKTSDSANVTGDNTDYSVTFTSEKFDLNGDYDTGTSLFTAPVTGKYLLGCRIKYVNASASNRGLVGIGINGPGASYYGERVNTSSYDNAANTAALGCQVLVEMTAGDSAGVSLLCSGGTKTVTCGSSATSGHTFFYGVLRE